MTLLSYFDVFQVWRVIIMEFIYIYTGVQCEVIKVVISSESINYSHMLY